MKMDDLKLLKGTDNMFYSIISEYDVFFSGDGSEFCEKQSGSGVMTMIKRDGKYLPHSFFSTDPADYLKAENQIAPYYY